MRDFVDIQRTKVYEGISKSQLFMNWEGRCTWSFLEMSEKEVSLGSQVDRELGRPSFEEVYLLKLISSGKPHLDFTLRDGF